MDFLICFEHVVREIENDTLLKHELEQRGYSCKILYINDIDLCRHATKDKAKVVVTPWMRYNTNVYRYLPIAKKPYKLVNLQWEQVYSGYGLKSGLTKTDGQALRAYHMCWGENSYNRLVDAGVPKENLAIVGAIQMDYGRALFKNYYRTRDSLASQYGLDANKKWNLLISSFAYANYGDNAIHRMEQSLNLSMAGYVSLHRHSQKLTLDWVEALLEVSDCEFIYRPHPSEKVDTRLQAMEEKYPHFHVISDCSVKQWAKVCDKANLWISTSNAELLSMGVDYAIVRPAEVPADYEVESMRDETFITDLDAFIRYNTTYNEDNGDAVREKLKRLEPFYSYNPDYPAYKRTADYLEQVLKSEKGQTFHFSFKQHLQESFSIFKRLIDAMLSHRCHKKGSLKPLAHLPIRSSVKNRIKKALQAHNAQKALENSMLDYLKQQTP